MASRADTLPPCKPTTPAREHAAILHKPYAQAVLSGIKTIESRLSVQRREPYGVVRPGERLWIRAAGGGFVARAVIARVEFHADLDEQGVDQLRARYGGLILGDEAYWEAKRRARYATLLWLSEVEPASHGPSFRWLPRSGWASRPVGRVRAGLSASR
jgi:hypothetical protein